MQASTFEMLRIEHIHDIVLPSVETCLKPLGFETQGPLRWIRSTDAPIRQCFRLEQWKGGILSPTWGLSLDFVPHLSGNQIKWHRAPKSALPDLTFDPRDRSMEVSYMRGIDEVAQLVPSVMQEAVIQAGHFWESACSIDQLPEVFAGVKRHLSSGGLGFYNFRQHPIAYAFVLAMNGHPDLAEAEFQKYTEGLPTTTRAKLREIFVAAGGRPNQYAAST